MTLSDARFRARFFLAGLGLLTLLWLVVAAHLIAAARF